MISVRTIPDVILFPKVFASFQYFCGNVNARSVNVISENIVLHTAYGSFVVTLTFT